MATSAPNQPPGSSSVSAPQPPQTSNPDQITWDGDKMFNIYILDYCKKRGYHKTASQLITEAEIAPDSKPPINAQQGLLFEWWSVFWVLFQAKNSGTGSEDAMVYLKHLNHVKLRAGQVPPPGVSQPPGRYSLQNGVSGTVPPLPNPHINGIGPTGQPPSLAASPYGPANPASQPNGIPGPTGPPGPPGQPFPGGMVGRPPPGPQQRLPNGGPPYHSPTIAPSPGNPQQPLAGPMSQLGRSPRMNTMNRAAMPPPNGPQHSQGPGPSGSAHPTPTPSYQRPPSRHDASQNPMNPHPSPALGGRMLPERSHVDGPPSTTDAELASYPPELVNDVKSRVGLGERDPQSLTQEEKQSILLRLKQSPPQNSGIVGGNMHGQLQNRGPPMQQHPSMQQQRVAKRNSTSPGEEHQTIPRNDLSPPDRKRLRKTPNPAEQQQQQPQQQQQQSQPQLLPQQPQQSQQPQQQPQQPPMAPIGPLPSGPQPGSMRLPMAGGQAPPNGFGGPPMHQMGMPGHMAPMHAMSSSMHGSLGVMNPQMAPSQVLYSQGQYRPGMMNHKGMPSGDPQAQAHMRGHGATPNRLPGQLVPPQPGQPPKGMGGPMLPPGQPGMNGPPKPGGKEGEGELNTPLNPAGPATPLLNNAPPMNPQRPPTASAPLPTPAPPPPAPGPGPITDLTFDMNDVFGNGGGDFTFDADPLSEMTLWFDPTAVHDGSALDMK